MPNLAESIKQDVQRLAIMLLEKSSVDILSLTKPERLVIYTKALNYAEEFAEVSNEYLNSVQLHTRIDSP